MTEHITERMPTLDEIYRFARSNPLTLWQVVTEVMELGDEDRAEMSGGRCRELWKLNGGAFYKRGRAWIEVYLLPKLLRSIFDANDKLRAVPSPAPDVKLLEALKAIKAHGTGIGTFKLGRRAGKMVEIATKALATSEPPHTEQDGT